MHQLVAILLIPILVVGNSFAHSHGPAAHSPASQHRAHFHFVGAAHHVHGHAAHGNDHGHSHHGEHHSHQDEHGDNGSQHEPIETPVDHDSDAIYLVTADLATTSANRVSIELDTKFAARVVEFEIVDWQSSNFFLQPDESPPSQLPLYLLHAALRL